MGRRLSTCVLLACLLSSGTLLGQDPGLNQTGNPLLQFFGPREFGAGPLNWSILQDRRGLIYAANADGVLEYDGVGWRLIRTDRRTRVRALAMDEQGRIYVGAQGEFGRLEPDASGELKFVSLSAGLPAAERDFSDIWLIHCLRSGVYFRSQHRLFRLADGRLKSWPMQDVSYSAALGERLLLFDRQRGLLELDGEDFRPVAGTSVAELGDVQAILPWSSKGQVELPGNALLLGSKEKGLQVWRDGAVTPLHSPVDPLLARDGLRGGRLLANGHVVLLSLAEGPLLLDARMQLLRRLGRNEGIAGDRAFEVALDRQGDLWLALDTGVARVAAFDPLTRIDEALLGGSVLTALRLDGRMYVGSNTRLTWLGAPSGEAGRNGVVGHVRHLLAFDGRLLTAGNGGVYQMHNGVTRSLRAGSASELRRSSTVPARLWVAERDGLASLRWQDGDWVDEGDRLATNSVVRSLAEDADGGLWLGTDLEGVLYLPRSFDVPPGPLDPNRVRRFGLAEGLPSEDENQIFELHGEVLVRTRDGIYRRDPSGVRFEPDQRFIGLFAQRPGWQLSPRGGLTVDRQGWIWSQARHVDSNDTELGALVPLDDGGYRWNTSGLLALRGTNVTHIYSDGDDALWFGTNEGLFRYDRRIRRDYTLDFTTLIRSIGHRDGRRLFGGGDSTITGAPAPLPAADNSLMIDYAAPSHVEPRATRYQTWLEGYESAWSPWTAASRKEYTNLAPGEYTFRVRARNVYDHIGAEAHYRFEVLAPVWQTWPAVFTYALLLFLFGWQLLRWRTRLLERDKALLARRVDERTEDLRRSSEMLALARDQAEHDRRVAEQATRSKSDFLASMSHEIRTPMNAIIGFAHLGRQLSLPPAAHDYFEKIAGAGASLLGIVNDILDFSKIEAGKLQLETTEFDLAEVLMQVENLFVHQAEAKGIELVLTIAAGVPPRLRGDPLRLGQILTNLSNNALKFTERGQVVLGVSLQGEQGGRVQLRFSVKDSGIGIAAERLPDLFQAFEQGEVGTARRYGGTGLGLSISQRLVQLMGGEFAVESTPGVGSDFAFTAWFDRGERPSRPLNLFERLGALRVLVVDDNPIVREVLVQQLRQFGAEAEAVDGATAAYAALADARRKGRPFGLVLLDWQMPGIDGLQASAHILGDAENPAPAAVIMVTAHGGNELRAQAREVGVRGVLGKPVSPSLLFNVVLQACDALTPVDTGLGADHGGADRPDLAGLRVLLVEDNPINQQVGTEILMLAGVEVTVAGSGEQALHLLGTQSFDAVLMDVHMPGMDGLHATRCLRLLPNLQAIPVIALSADAMPGHREACLAAGMNDSLSKPVEPERLYAVLAQWTGRGEGYAPAARDDAAAEPVGSPPLFDAQRAINRLGGQTALYRRLLGEFLTDWGDLPSRLPALDASAAQKLAHNYKGVAGHLGATAAQFAADRVDGCLRRGEHEAFETALAALREIHADTVAAAREWLATTAPAPSVSVDPDGRAASALLEELDRRIQQRDPAAEDLLPALRAALPVSIAPARLDALEQSLARFDFKAAIEHQRGLRETLGAPSGPG